MSILSLGYLLFLLLGILFYYLCSNKLKPYFLLALSLIFVGSYNIGGLLFIVFESFIVYFAAISFENLSSTKKKLILLTSIILCLAILFVLKYLPEISIFNEFFIYKGQQFNFKKFIGKFIYPIGLSYFTLQLISYLLDVYWEKIKSEKNYFKVLLFTCYFPQMVQGPISKYHDLDNEIFRNHSFNINNLLYGFQLILWGYFKKTIISDRTSIVTERIFNNGVDTFGFNVWIGLVLFGIQLYTEFSGGIDIIRGTSKCFDISLIDNFKQPFFSNSLGEFWRRWHISLGRWMKDYVFYPLSISQSLNKFKKILKQITTRKVANRIGIAICDMIVFLFVGIWHGTGSNYLGWGLYNGIILSLSAVLVDEYAKWKRIFRINDKSYLWKFYTWIRTFIIVTIGWIFDCTDNLSGAIRTFINSFLILKSDIRLIQIAKIDFLILLVAIAILIIFSILNEKKGDFISFLNNAHPVISFIFWLCVLQIIMAFGYIASGGDFMYANI